MKNKIFLLSLFFTVTFNMYCQNEKKNNITEAISYLNLFLNKENWIVKTTGSISYNNYSKTLSYEFKSVSDDENKTVSDINFSFSLNNITRWVQLF